MKNKSSNEKVTIYLAIFFILFLVVIVLLYVFGVIGKGAPTVDVVLNREYMITYKKDKWEKVLSKDYENYNWNKFGVYEEGQKKGTYSLYTPDGDFYLFKVKNNSRTPIETLENSLYLGGRKDSKFIEFGREELSDSDKEYVKSILRKNNISETDLDNYILGYKIIQDFDNDDKKEIMYIVSNMFSMNVNDTAYSFIFVKDGEKNNIIYKKILDAPNRFSGCYAYLLGLVKIDGDDYTQIITSCKSYSVSNNNEYGIYRNRNNNYELLLYIK
ncbi:MAG: hypothetical protein ILA19_04675 [Bacilli bacterium]|nr:hypothetical protein [Bacilli bacterium]